jgi:hypothetical protein
MADGTFPSLVSKDRAVNAVANPIYTQLTDGTAVLTVTGGALNVNVANSSIAVTGTFYRDLKAGTGSGEDNVLIFANTVKDGTGTDLVPLVDSDGNLQVDVLTMPALSLGAEFNVDDAAGAADAGLNVLVVRDDALSTLTPVDGDYVSLRVGSTGALWTTFTNTTIGVTASDLDIRNLTLSDDAVKISGNANANSITNPIFVQNVKTSTQAQEIHDYLDGTSTGETGSNHDYTVAGTTFLLTSVIVACSGAMKAEIQTGPVGSLATKAVVFLTGRQGDTKQVFFDPPIEVPVTSTGTVRVIRTSRNGIGVNVDLYSTIIGNDVA